MDRIPDLDGSELIKALIEEELPCILEESAMVPANFAPSDCSFFQKRERIDSEDFVLPRTTNKRAKDNEAFPVDANNQKAPQAEESRSRRKSSVLPNTDPTLLELEVSSVEVFVQPHKQARRCEVS